MRSQVPVVPLEQPHRRGPIAKDVRYTRVVFEHFLQGIETDIPYGRIGGSFPFATGHHIPQGDMGRYQHVHLRIPIGKRTPAERLHDRPEGVGGMSVVFMHFQRFHAGHGSQYQYPAIRVHNRWKPFERFHTTLVPWEAIMVKSKHHPL